MKKIMLLITLAINIQLYAQENDNFFNGKDITSTWYGAVSNQFTRINGKAAVFTGIYGGWMINHKLMIGLGGYGMVTNQDGFNSNGEKDANQDLIMGYGGIMTEYTFMGNKKIHATANLLIGGGGVENGHKLGNPHSYGSNYHTDSESRFTVLEPSVNIEANMTNWFRVSAGGSYRLVQGSNMPGLTDRKLSAPAMNITLKFGKF